MNDVYTITLYTLHIHSSTLSKMLRLERRYIELVLLLVHYSLFDTTLGCVLRPNAACAKRDPHSRHTPPHATEKRKRKHITRVLFHSLMCVRMSVYSICICVRCLCMLFAEGGPVWGIWIDGATATHTRYKYDPMHFSHSDGDATDANQLNRKRIFRRSRQRRLRRGPARTALNSVRPRGAPIMCACVRVRLCVCLHNRRGGTTRTQCDGV